MRKLFKNKYYLLMICVVVCFYIALVYTFSGTLNAKQNVREIYKFEVKASRCPVYT